MKNAFIVLLAVIAVSLVSYFLGNFLKDNKYYYSEYSIVPVDTISVHDTLIVIDSTQIKKLQDSLDFIKRDTIFIIDNSITYENFSNARKIEKIKYYISICENRPVNKKYFFGWIKRTMSD